MIRSEIQSCAKEKEAARWKFLAPVEVSFLQLQLRVKARRVQDGGRSSRMRAHRGRDIKGQRWRRGGVEGKQEGNLPRYLRSERPRVISGLKYLRNRTRHGSLHSLVSGSPPFLQARTTSNEKRQKNGEITCPK